MIIAYLLVTSILIYCVESFHYSNVINNRFNKRFSSNGNNRGPPDNRSWKLGMGDIPDNDTNKAIDANKDSDNVIAKKWKGLSDETRDDIKTTAISFTFALIIRIFLVEPRFIPSLSMFPTFDIGDQLLVDKVTHIARPYQRKDVVVFNPSDTYIELTGNTEALIKRIVATAGDEVEVKDSYVYVNGVKQDEPYINERPNYSLAPLKVPPGMLLVLGDNRNHSFDSHVWGFLPEENVVGRAFLKYWPPWRIGLVEGSG